MNARTLLMSALALQSLPAAPALAGDTAVGKRVYEEECMECHSINGRNKKGPTLVGALGRKAGTVKDYEGNSDAMKASNIVWNEDALNKYLAAPKKLVPGTKMKYDGLADAKSRMDVIAFISTLK